MKETSVFEWLNLLESCGADDVSIRRREKFTLNGIRQYSDPLPVRAVNTSRTSQNTGEHDQLHTIWLLPGKEPEIAPGDLLVYNDCEYEICKVEYCCNLAGETVARRCSTL